VLKDFARTRIWPCQKHCLGRKLCWPGHILALAGSFKKRKALRAVAEKELNDCICF
jgi:hypothetical protein